MEAAAVGLRDLKKARTRARIAEAAWTLFEEQGYDAVTLTQIAERAEVSRRTLFHYFASKEALLFPGLEQYVAELSAAFQARPAAEALLDSVGHALQAGRGLISETVTRRAAGPQVSARQASPAALSYLQDRICGVIGDLVAGRYPADTEGALKAQVAGRVAGAVVAVAAEQWLVGGGRDHLADHARAVLDVLREITTTGGRTLS